MPGYLLDTNHVDGVCRKEAKIIAKLESLPTGTQVRASVITLGEVEAGHQTTRTTNQRRRDEWTEQLNAQFLPEALHITPATRHTYAQIVSGILRAHPKKPNRRTEFHLVKQGVDINDVWIAASALEHGLTLVTTDHMDCIREAAPHLKIECWL